MTSKEPTLEELVQSIRKWLTAHGENEVSVNLEEQELTVTSGEQVRVMFLGNLYRGYCEASLSERPKVLDFFLSGLQEANQGFGLTFDSARPHLVPVVRDMYSMQRMPTRPGGSTGGVTARPVCRPLLGDMVVGLAVDQPHSIVLVPQNLLDKWGRTFDECFEVAMGNLRAMSRTPNWIEVAPGVWDAAWGDSYESSRVLLPEVIEPLRLKSPMAMVPFRDSFFVTSADNPQAVALMARMVEMQSEKNDRWVSFRLLALQSNRWVEQAPPAAARTVLQELELRQLATAYDHQRSALEKEFAANATDLYVGSLRLVRRADSPLTSIVVWSSGVDALLPVADLVAVSELSKTDIRAAVVPWSVVQERFGALLEPTDHIPPRKRVRSFPTPAEMDQLLRDFPMKRP